MKVVAERTSFRMKVEGERSRIFKNKLSKARKKMEIKPPNVKNIFSNLITHTVKVADERLAHGVRAAGTVPSRSIV
jgi:hypothetical protein